MTGGFSPFVCPSLLFGSEDLPAGLVSKSSQLAYKSQPAISEVLPTGSKALSASSGAPLVATSSCLVNLCLWGLLPHYYKTDRFIPNETNGAQGTAHHVTFLQLFLLSLITICKIMHGNKINGYLLVSHKNVSCVPKTCPSPFWEPND